MEYAVVELDAYSHCFQDRFGQQGVNSRWMECLND